MYSQQIRGVNYTFPGLIDVMAKASPPRSGDELAGCAADSDGERAAAQWVLADIPLTAFLNDVLIPYEDDEVTRLIIDSHDAAAFAPLSHLTVGGFREWLLDTGHARTRRDLAALAPRPDPGDGGRGLQADAQPGPDRRCRANSRVVTAFRNTLGLPGRLSTRCSPTTRPTIRVASPPPILDGLLLGCGDAVIGINPATDSPRHGGRAAVPARRDPPADIASRRSPACWHM